MTERSVQQRNLLVACARGEYDFLEKYIRKNPQKRKYEVFDNHRWGPLHHAVASNSYDCVQLLLSSGLVDTKWRSFEGQTCLFVAVDRGASQAIIKALLKADSDLFNLSNNESVYPMHKAVLKNSLETVQTMVETLNEMRVTFADQFDWDYENCLFLAARAKNLQIMEYLLTTDKHDPQHLNDAGLNAVTIALLPCEENMENEAFNRFEIFKRLVPLTYDLSADNCMQRMMLSISFTCLFKHREIFQWIIEHFYLSTINEHRDLVQKVLNTLQLVDFDYQIVLVALHSKLPRFVVNDADQLKNDILYSNIFNDLRNIFNYDRELFIEIVAVMRPKLDSESLNYVMLKFIPNESIDRTQMLDDFIQMFDIMQIGDLLNIRKLLLFTPSPTYLNNLLLLLMPFSTESTADIFIEKRLKDKLFTDTTPYERDDGLVRFCINGMFRSKCDLKCLCRATIRSNILHSNEIERTNHERLNQIRSMQIPIPIKNFLLFNYTRYDFK
ncbi:uncharacterized protein LOC129569047 [Sitodiplosis mosellana]|uniref:uncharacterized protein LOC129569047 n=1 Tax=Sitodiplosis mosellana TaxID=263140 RepID=UPI00244419EE|nr:uncharacterized protein LOC129569047 [Sitodiplosis mosellana]